MPVDVEKRVNYFDGQFLKAEDFIAEQEYHVDRQQAHNQMLHTPGIAGGLDVTANGGATEAEVAAGMALDAEGHQIVLAGPRTVDLRPYAGQTVLLLISYDEAPSDPAAVGDGDTRMHERPRVEAVVEAGAPPASTHVRLGRVVVNASGTVTSYSDSVRISAGVQLGDEMELRTLTISRSRVDPARWPTLTSGATGRADLSGSLRVDGALAVTGELAAGGPARLGNTLNVASSADIGGAFSAGGNSTMRGNAEVGGNLTVTGGAIINGVGGVASNLTVGGELTVSDAGRFNGALRVVGQATLAGASLSGSLSVDDRVGIGTTNPASYNTAGNSLVVRSASANGNGMTIASPTTGRGHLFFADGITGNSEYRGGITYDHGTGMGGGADTLYFRTAGAVQASIDSSGNLGIGTTNPDRSLTVFGSSGTYLNVKANNGATELLMGAASGSGGIVSTMTNHDLQLRAGGNDTKVTIKAGGDVGIGTASPTAKLDVFGEIRGSFFRAGQGNAGSVTAGNWYRIAENTGGGKRANAEFTLRDVISGGGHSTVTFRVGSSYNDANGMSFTLLGHSRYQNTTFTKARVLENNTYDAQYLEVFANRTGSVEYSIYDNLQTDPWVPVDWTAGVAPAGYEVREYDLDQLFAVGDYRDRFAVSRGGEVGIGTTSPDRQLTVEGTGATYLNVKANSGATEVLLGADSNGGIVSTMTNHDLQFRAGSNSTKMTIKASGDVGIGTTNPSATLHVVGDSILQQADWQAADLINGWTRYSTSYNEPGFFKDSMGVVHLRGLLRIGTASDVFVLPAGYRPARRELFTGPVSTTEVHRVDVLTNGRVYVAGPVSGFTWLSLDGISFRAAPSVLFAVAARRVLSIT